MGAFLEVPAWVELEHKVAEILTEQEHHGWSFNEGAAWKLASSIKEEHESIEQILRDRYPYIRGQEFTPKRDNRTIGYVQDAPCTRQVDFNPRSRDHIAWILKHHFDWEPTELTKTGKPIINEAVLNEIDNDFSKKSAQLLYLTKCLGFLTEGEQAWMKLTKMGKIHHHCYVSCVSGRASHRGPNLAQVPADSRFRELFTASEGMEMVGADLSGIELRMLAHYLGRYDQGRYAEVLLHGDIHQETADKIGVTRRQVKTITYAMIYGASNTKLGFTYDSSLSKQEAASKGAEIRSSYLAAIPGLETLIEAVKQKAVSGKIRSLDGRNIFVSSPHKSLNLLLQSGAASVAKVWMCMANDWVKDNKMDAHQLAFVHDEIQYECKPKDIDDLKYSLELHASMAGERFKLRCPIAAEASSGSNWATTH